MTARAVLGDAARTLGGWLAALAQDLREMSVTGPRARLCVGATASVLLSVVVADAAHLDFPWWAALSGFMSSQATRPASIRRGVLRIAGTFVGAALAVAAMPFIAYDHVAFYLFVFTAGAIGQLGMAVSPHGYAWLFAGVTALLIVMVSLNDPSDTANFAGNRLLEVVIGSGAGVLVSLVLAPEADAPATPAPGWSDLLGASWPAVLHAVRAGLTVMLLPLAWSWLGLPNLVQMAVTVSIVMVVPVLSDRPLDRGRMIVTRAVHRVLGCFFGGLAALGCLAVSATGFLPWLLLLGAGVWVGCHVQTSTRGIGYIGTQWVIGFIVTLVQGNGPPDSIIPGIDRFAGMLGGIALVLLVSLLLWPSPPQEGRPAPS